MEVSHVHAKHSEVSLGVFRAKLDNLYLYQIQYLLNASIHFL